MLSWNMYLMFDDVDDGDEYEPFKGSNKERYQERIRLYGEYLYDIDVDLMAFMEIESEKVLKDLIDSGLGRKGFRYYSIADKKSPISVGFISRYKPERVYVHRSGISRPFLEAQFRVGDDLLSVFILHAKSRIGGGEEQRRETFEHVSALATNAGHPCLIAGDFNEDPEYGPSFSWDRAKKPALLVAGREELLSDGVFYSKHAEDGISHTYSYEGAWYAYDHILSSWDLFDHRKLEHLETYVITDESLMDEEGKPERWSDEEWKGMSDHLPIVTRLRYY